jgi:hypothetical protein
VITSDTLRLPNRLDPAIGAYKDWLHLNVFDHDSDMVGLVNVSIHGPPENPASQVVAAALVDVGGTGWVGNVVPGSWADASITPTSMLTAAVSVAFGDDGKVLAAAAVDGLRLDVVAEPVTRAYAIEDPQQFGSGWIGWRLLPRLTVDGAVELNGRRLAQNPAAYQDHTWGRWHWGDDIGWEWGICLGRTGSSIVFGRTTDQGHRNCGPITVVVDHDRDRRVFYGSRVACHWSGVANPPGRRLPGALAALHDDRRRPRLPSGVHIAARAGKDVVDLEFTCRSVVQLILADPVAPGGYSFLHEMSGRFRASGRIAGKPLEIEGLGMLERLE